MLGVTLDTCLIRGGFQNSKAKKYNSEKNLNLFMLFLLPITSHTQLFTHDRVRPVQQCTVYSKVHLSDHPSKRVSGNKGRLSQPGINFELYLSCYI